MILTIASSFFIPLLFAAPLCSQVRVQVRAGYAGSGVVVRDAIASEVLRARFGPVEDEVTATLTPAPTVGAAVEIPLRRGTHVVLTGTWSGSKLQADGDGGRRDVQDVTLLQGVFGIRRMLGNTIEVGAGFGGMHFNSEDRALMAGGSSIAPLVEASFGGGWNTGPHRTRVRAVGQLHRFGTNAMSAVGGRSGNVMRYGIEAGVTWKGAVLR